MDTSRFALQPDETPWIAVSIERTTPCNTHAGIVYRDAGQKLRHLHFAWHERLLDVDCRSDLPCARPNVDPADELFLAGFCGKIARSAANSAIPYNLKHDPEVNFDPQTGTVRFGPESTGLGCATFVIAAFRSSGNALIDMSAWPAANSEDVAVREVLIDSLRAGDSGKRAQADRIESEINSPRVRPEHVAGACLEDAYPVKHKQCDENGQWVDSQLPPAA
jgi:hypothetical protein